MNDLLLGYALTIVLIVACGLIYVLYRYFMGNKLSQQADKLKSQMAKIRQDFPELGRKPREYVAETIGDIGIEGIMEELGIDPGLLKNPLVKGLIDKYAPRLIEKMTKGGNEQEGSGNNFL